jgi:hypothetical protein
MSAPQLDVYRDWLGIQEPNRPLNYYQLLRLKPFEDNPATIREHYRKMNAHIRKYASGNYASQSQALLNELARAMLCLTDTERKLEYDISLGRKVERKSARRTIEEILTANGILSAEQLKKVKNYANAIGIDLHEAVLQQKKEATPEDVLLAYAESVGLPFVNIEEVGVAEEIYPQVNPNTARLYSFVPLMIDRGHLLIASPKPLNPDIEDELRILFDVPVRNTICTPADISAALTKYYPKDAAQLIRKSGETAVLSPPKKSKKSETEKDEPVRKKVQPSAGPMNDEEKKDRLMTAIVAFNFTVMVVCFALYFLKLPVPAWHNTTVSFVLIGLIAAPLGAVAGLVTWSTKTR